MQPIASISAEELRQDPGARLWALIHYLGEQRGVHPDRMLNAVGLAFFYDAEVLNGGHLQYFHNRGTSQAVDTVAALEQIGAVQHASLLREAIEIVEGAPIKRVKSLEEYSRLAASSPFDELDSQYYGVRPEVLDHLERYIGPRLELLVTVVPDA